MYKSKRSVRRLIHQHVLAQPTLACALNTHQSHTGPRPTSGRRADARSRHFISQPLRPIFCWPRLQTRPPGGRSGAARRASPLIPGQEGALGRRSALPGPRRCARAFEPENAPLEPFPPPRGGAVLTPLAFPSPNPHLDPTGSAPRIPRPAPDVLRARPAPLAAFPAKTGSV